MRFKVSNYVINKQIFSNLCTKLIRVFASLVLALLLIAPTFIIVGPVCANPQGSTTNIYFGLEREINSTGPNSISIEGGQVAIILADGTRLMILPVVTRQEGEDN